MDYTVANTIKQQLGAKALFMMNAQKFVALENGLKFRISNCRKFNHIQIVLNASDLYNVTFFKLVGTKFTSEVHEDIYSDQLHSLIHNQTGLYLSL